MVKRKDAQSSLITDKQDAQKENNPAELLRLYQIFSHTSFQRLRAMARQGVIPKKCASNCAIQACLMCLCAKATWQPWRTKTANNEVEETPTVPGQLILVDQLKSPTPGFIAQMCRTLMVKRHTVATVFVDQASRFSHVHYQKSCTTEEKLEAKRMFEKLVQNNGVMVKNCHGDNGVFKTNKWMAD